MPEFELISYQEFLKCKKIEGQTYVFDPVRRKYILLQPEEFVRQLFIQFMNREIGFSLNRMQVEKQFMLNSLQKRFDLIIFDSTPKPRILVECKNSSIRLTQNVLEQITRYNLVYKVDYLLITNGIQYYSYKIDFENSCYYAMDEIPSPLMLEKHLKPSSEKPGKSIC